MAESSPFPELSFEDLDSLVNLDPELELSNSFETSLEPFPYGISPSIDFMLGDLAVSEGGYIPFVEDHDAVAQWALQTCLHEKFESPLVSGVIGLEVRGRIGEIITTGLMVQIALQVPAALKAHDRITRVLVDRVFSIYSNIYLMVQYETDDQESRSLLVQVEG